MSLTFSSMDILIGPKWRNRDPFDRERLAHAKQRQRGGHHGGGKNHATGKRNAALRRRKRK